MSKLVVFVVAEGFHLLDMAGPLQVFATAADQGADYATLIVGDADRIRSHQGVTVAATPRWPELNPRDLVIVPGWKWESRTIPIADALLNRVAEHRAAGGQVASVCGGAFALARAGLLRDVPSTTHHELTDELARVAPGGVQRDVLYTCSPGLHTSAGIASGIDLALHLVDHDHGPAFAAEVARALVVPAWRPGAGPQVPTTLAHRDHMSDMVHRAQAVLDQANGPAPNLRDLAGRLGVSGRTLARRFSQATGMSPHAYATAVRRERAAELVANGWTREVAARAVGFADARSLRRR